MDEILLMSLNILVLHKNILLLKFSAPFVRSVSGKLALHLLKGVLLYTQGKYGTLCI